MLQLHREIAATDAEIDELVYELYGITDEERKIIEGVLSRRFMSAELRRRSPIASRQQASGQVGAGADRRYRERSAGLIL